MEVQVVRHWKSPEERDDFWRDLLCRFDGRVEAYARRACFANDETSEVVWDLWEEAVRRELALLESPDPWEILLPLLRRLCARRIRIRRHERADARAVDHYAVSDSIVGSSEALAEWMGRVLSELTPRQRAVIEGRYGMGWSYKAIAAAIGTAEATARVHVLHALARLRRFSGQVPPPRQVTPIRSAPPISCASCALAS
jgi:RNA polymerase sigma factor (sigma-70 family)